MLNLFLTKSNFTNQINKNIEWIFIATHQTHYKIVKMHNE